MRGSGEVFVISEGRGVKAVAENFSNAEEQINVSEVTAAVK